MNDKRCACPISISVLGDGCRYCQPQGYIDRQHSLFADEVAEHTEWLESLLKKVKDKYEIETADILLAELNERLEELKE